MHNPTEYNAASETIWFELPGFTLPYQITHKAIDVAFVGTVVESCL